MGLGVGVAGRAAGEAGAPAAPVAGAPDAGMEGDCAHAAGTNS